MRHELLTAFFPARSVFSCNISSTAAHVLLSKADGQIGDMKNLPTAIAWECPWHTGDNLSEISNQTREASKFTQLETVYTDLCKQRPVMLPALFKVTVMPPGLFILQIFFKMLRSFSAVPLSSCPHWASKENQICFSSGRAELRWGESEYQMYFSSSASLTDGKLFFYWWISCLNKEIRAKTPREMGLRFVVFFFS